MSNRLVTFHGARDMRIDTYKTPELTMPNGKKAPHAVILKIVATNICGSDLHIYRGSFAVPKGMTMGHEMTGEVVEVGSDVEFIKKGDIVSVPFNVGCGRCYNCHHMRTDVCENVNGEQAMPIIQGHQQEVDCGAYGFNLGPDVKSENTAAGWAGGQGDYLLVPYADFNLLKFQDREAALEKIRDLTLLSDILPTAFHGFAAPAWPAQPSFGVGQSVLIFGAGPVGRCGAACAKLLGYGAIIVADYLQERLDLLKGQGIETINLSEIAISKDKDGLEDRIEQITGKRMVDRVIDYVGVDCRGFGTQKDELVENAITNALLKYVRFGGTTSTVGVYCANPIAGNETNKKGGMEIDWAGGWIKSPRMSAGQSPTMNYNHGLMNAIMYDRMPYLSAMLNTTIITMDEVPQAYKDFAEGSPYKYVIDPHGVTGTMGQRGLNPQNLSPEKLTPLKGNDLLAYGVKNTSFISKLKEAI